MPAPLSGSFSLLPGREVTMKLHKGNISLKSFQVPISMKRVQADDEIKRIALGQLAGKLTNRVDGIGQSGAV